MSVIVVIYPSIVLRKTHDSMKFTMNGVEGFAGKAETSRCNRKVTEYLEDLEDEFRR